MLRGQSPSDGPQNDCARHEYRATCFVGTTAACYGAGCCPAECLVFASCFLVPQWVVGFGPLLTHCTACHGTHGALDPDGCIDMHDNAHYQYPGSDGVDQGGRPEHLYGKVGCKPGTPEQHAGNDESQQAECH